MLRERLRARPDLPLRQSAVHSAGDLHGRHGARDEHERDHGANRGDEQAREDRGWLERRALQGHVGRQGDKHFEFNAKNQGHQAA